MAHVFIVDDQTLPVHLRYAFAGTGAKDYKCEFLKDPSARFQSTIERLLTGMVADISRIRVGDEVIFYLQQSKNHEGMFFGCFRVVEAPFLSLDDYLKDELGKNLTFRVLLEPSRVFAKGATERDCLDSLKDINHPSDMCWSLIYRKLKGNRGCTMITDAEYRHIVQKLEQNNSGTLPNRPLTYDQQSCEIKLTGTSETYIGKKSTLGIKDRLLNKYSLGQAYETHLQAYILQHLEELPDLFLTGLPISWIGNEVSCGVGMQSIDVMFIQEDNDAVYFTVCELKDEQPESYIKAQVEKYVDWIKDYLAPQYNKKVIIRPTIIAPEPNDRTKALFGSIRDITQEGNGVFVSQINYLGFKIVDNNLVFNAVS